MDWIAYEAEGEDYVPMEKWGKDHWSTLAYLETVVVDHRGRIDNRKMRTDPRLHREFYSQPPGMSISESGYPTRLKDGEKLEDHDDWSCLEDMVKKGLVRAWFCEKKSDSFFDKSFARVELTEFGWRVAHSLRRHRASGKKYAEFAKVMAEYAKVMEAPDG